MLIRGGGLGDVPVPAHDPANVYTAEDARLQAQWDADVAKMKQKPPMSTRTKIGIGVAVGLVVLLVAWKGA